MHISYLACPYSHPNKETQDKRHNTVNQVAYELIKKGNFIYSPLTHDIPLSKLGLYGNWQTWMTFDHEMLRRCDDLIVLRLEGWEDSLGVQAEIKCAQELKKPIKWLDLKDGELFFSQE